MWRGSIDSLNAKVFSGTIQTRKKSGSGIGSHGRNAKRSFSTNRYSWARMKSRQLSKHDSMRSVELIEADTFSSLEHFEAPSSV